jgi:FkbM family methyltransferase
VSVAERTRELCRALADPVRRIGPIWRQAPRRFFILSQYRRFRNRISFRRGGFHWTGFAWDEDVTWYLYVYGDYQGEERRALARWMRRNGYLGSGRELIVEVGANIGTTSLPLARDLDCRVLAIEPEPQNFALLEANVRSNGMEERIACELAAVAGRAGTVTLVLPADTSGGVELLPPDGAHPRIGVAEAPAQSGAPVRAAPLSELLGERRVDPSEVAFVWSDAQGSDGHVIRTGTELWGAGVPLYMELWPAALRRQRTDDAVAAVASYGFRAFIESKDLIADEAPSPRPVAELPRLMERYSGEDQTDVLLIPG